MKPACEAPRGPERRSPGDELPGRVATELRSAQALVSGIGRARPAGA